MEIETQTPWFMHSKHKDGKSNPRRTCHFGTRCHSIKLWQIRWSSSMHLSVAEWGWKPFAFRTNNRRTSKFGGVLAYQPSIDWWTPLLAFPREISSWTFPLLHPSFPFHSWLSSSLYRSPHSFHPHRSLSSALISLRGHLQHQTRHPRYRPPTPKKKMANEEKPEAEKPEVEKPKSSPFAALNKCFGTLKNMFGCLKSGEEAYAQAPPQFTQEIQSQVPEQQVSSSNLLESKGILFWSIWL